MKKIPLIYRTFMDIGILCMFIIFLSVIQFKFSTNLSGIKFFIKGWYIFVGGIIIFILVKKGHSKIDKYFQENL